MSVLIVMSHGCFGPDCKFMEESTYILHPYFKSALLKGERLLLLTYTDVSFGELVKTQLQIIPREV